MILLKEQKLKRFKNITTLKVYMKYKSLENKIGKDKIDLKEWIPIYGYYHLSNYKRY